MNIGEDHLRSRGRAASKKIKHGAHGRRVKIVRDAFPQEERLGVGRKASASETLFKTILQKIDRNSREASRLRVVPQHTVLESDHGSAIDFENWNTRQFLHPKRPAVEPRTEKDRKSTRLTSSHLVI